MTSCVVPTPSLKFTGRGQHEGLEVDPSRQSVLESARSLHPKQGQGVRRRVEEDPVSLLAREEEHCKSTALAEVRAGTQE